MKKSLKLLLSFVFCLCLLFSAVSVSTLAESQSSTGFIEQDGKTYYYINDQMYVGWLNLDGNFYFFDRQTGTMVKGLFTSGTSSWYFDTQSGIMQKGLVNTSDGTRYFDAQSGQMKTGWVTINGDTYYFDKTSGIMKTGLFTDGNGTYWYFDTATGIMQKGWITANGNTYFFNRTSGQATKGLFSDGNGTYWYFDTATGIMKTGWVTENGNTYFFNRTSGQATKGLFSDGNGTYWYFDTATGIMKTGWITANGNTYFFSKTSGQAAKGMFTDGKGTYWYFDLDTGIMQKGWIDYYGDTYFFNRTSGQMTKGWFTDGKGAYWYFDADTGVMQRGWLTLDGDTYFFYVSSGQMAVGHIIIDGVEYYFNRKGKLSDVDLHVCIDAGHGGSDPGAISGSRYEKNDTLRVALEVKRVLLEQGVTVTMTRSGDTRLVDSNSKLDLYARTDLANAAGCDVFVSIHRNSASSSYVSGLEIYTHNPANDNSTDETIRPTHSADSNKHEVDPILCENLMNELASVGYTKRFIREGSGGGGDTSEDYTVNRRTNMPSCLIELGYITNASDNALLDNNLKAIAKAIAKGIMETFDYEFDDS